MIRLIISKLTEKQVLEGGGVIISDTTLFLLVIGEHGGYEFRMRNFFICFFMSSFGAVAVASLVQLIVGIWIREWFVLKLFLPVMIVTTFIFAVSWQFIDLRNWLLPTIVLGALYGIGSSCLMIKHKNGGNR